jgi:Arabinose efflux permease
MLVQVKIMKSDKRIIIIFGVTLIAVMGISSITPAFPGIIKYFGISAKQVGLLITAFTLPGIFLTPLTGVLADRFGRKTVLVPSLFIFGIAGFACSLTKDFNSLLALLFIEGIGASGLSSINITLIGDFFQGEKRTALMGYNASILSIGTATYPAIGGFIALWGWQYIFYLPLVAIPLGIYVLFALESSVQTNNQPISEYFKKVWKTVNQRNVWGLLTINLLIFVLLYGSYLTYFPIMMSERMQATSVQIGVMMSIMSLITAGISSQLGRISRQLAAKKLLAIGSAFYFISMLILWSANNWIGVTFSVVFFGFGHGLMVPSVQNLLVSFATIKERAAFMSINSMVLRVGQTTGPLMVGAAFAIFGLNGAFMAGAGIALAMLFPVLITLKELTSANKT